jgi:hypothetical protein
MKPDCALYSMTRKKIDALKEIVLEDDPKYFEKRFD